MTYGSKRDTKVAVRPLLPNLRNGLSLGCKVLKKVSLCQVERTKGLGQACGSGSRRETSRERGDSPKAISGSLLSPETRYSSVLKNSIPKSRRSPAACWRRTLPVMGGVSLGTKPEDAGAGVGMVR